MSENPASRRSVVMLIVGLVVGIGAGVAIHAFAGRDAAANSPARPATSTAAAPPREQASVVHALGRLRPRNGVMTVAGPSQLTVVVGKLLVEEGDRLRRGQVIAVLDNQPAQQAAVERLRASVEAQLAGIARAEAQLRTAQNEYARLSKLHQEGTISDSQRDSSKLEVEAAAADVRRGRAEINLARADLRRSQEELEMAFVRAPIDGQVLKIHTRPGEKVGPAGIVELADNEQMYAVAEVYETDVSRIEVGQRARVKTPVFAGELTGVVERIGLKIGKMDVLGTDPAAKTDARVVEVEVRLDDSRRVHRATNLQVTISIDVSQPKAAAAGA